MRYSACEHEETVLAVGGDELGAALGAHVATCENCGEARRMVAGLRRLADDDRLPRIPTAAQVWWRARIVRRLSGRDPRFEHARRPVAWGLGIGAMTALVALAVAAMLAFSQMREALSGASAAPAAGWTYFVLLVGVVPAVATAVLFRWILREA